MAKCCDMYLRLRLKWHSSEGGHMLCPQWLAWTTTTQSCKLGHGDHTDIRPRLFSAHHTI